MRKPRLYVLEPSKLHEKWEDADHCSYCGLICRAGESWSYHKKRPLSPELQVVMGLEGKLKTWDGKSPYA
jgi:hypothetical protein